MLEIDGFLDEIESAFLHGRDGFVDGAESRKQNDGNCRVGLFGFAQDVESRSAGHL